MTILGYTTCESSAKFKQIDMNNTFLSSFGTDIFTLIIDVSLSILYIWFQTFDWHTNFRLVFNLINRL